MEKEENIVNKQMDDDKAPAQATTPALKPEMSLGEKWYDRILYQGINYWLNLGISLAVTDYFLHGKGSGFFKNGVEKLSGQLMTSGMGRARAKWAAGQMLGTFSLNSGGNILIIPTKFIEDDKRAWVYWLNDKLGVDQTAEDGHKKTVDEIYIEKVQDPQSWPRMIGRRVLGWIATTATGMTLDHALAQKLKTPMMVDGEQVLYKSGQDVFTDNTKSAANYVLGNFVPGGKSIVQNDMAQRYMGYAALDWIYTIITSQVLHATNGAHKEKKEDEKKTTTETAPEAEENKDGVVMPVTTHATDTLRHKEQGEGFADAIARQAEAAAPMQLGA